MNIYYGQGKNTRDIAKELNVTRDIGVILRDGEKTVYNGDDGNKKGMIRITLQRSVTKIYENL